MLLWASWKRREASQRNAGGDDRGACGGADAACAIKEASPCPSLAQAHAENANFYNVAYKRSEKRLLKTARQMEGLEAEIAVLRVEILKLMKNQPEGFDFRLLTHGIDMLVKAVAAQYRMSPKATKHLADHMTNLLNSLGDQFLPADR